MRSLFLSNSFSFFLFQNILFFPHTFKLIKVKLWFGTRYPLDHREIWTSGSELIFTHPHHWDLQNNVYGGRIFLAHTQWNWDSNPSSFNLTLGNSNRVTRGKAWRIIGNYYKCRYHCWTTHMSPLKGKGWVYRNWG